MKKEDKTRITREKIIQAAVAEFGTKSYEAASLNTICTEYGISKGLIYHNFKNKDELYLICVQKCYEEITAYISTGTDENENIRENIKAVLERRRCFFEKYPHYEYLFFCSVFMPPSHLKEEVRCLRHSYNEWIREYYRMVLGQIALRDGVTIEKAVNYFMMLQEMYNGYFRELCADKADIQSLIEFHEVTLSELLDVMFYGIAVQTKKE